VNDIEIQVSIDALDVDIFQLHRRLDRLYQKKANVQAQCNHSKTSQLSHIVQNETHDMCLICNKTLVRYTYGGIFRD